MQPFFCSPYAYVAYTVIPSFLLIPYHEHMFILFIHVWTFQKFVILLLCFYLPTIRGVFKKRPNFVNSAPTTTESALRLLSAPSVRFWQQTAVCRVSLWSLVVELHPMNWARAQAVRRISDKVTMKELEEQRVYITFIAVSASQKFLILFIFFSASQNINCHFVWYVANCPSI